MQEVHWAPLVEVPLLGDLNHQPPSQWLMSSATDAFDGDVICGRSGTTVNDVDGISEISGMVRAKLAESSQKARRRRWMESQTCSDVEPKLWSSSRDAKKFWQLQSCSANLLMRCDPVIPYTFIPWPKVKAINSSGASRHWGQLHCETLPFSSAEACHGQTWTLLEGRSEVCKPRWTSGAASRGTIDLCYFTYRMALEEILKPGFVSAWWDLSKRTSILTRFPQLFSRRRGVSQPFLPQTDGFSFTI